MTGSKRKKAATKDFEALVRACMVAIIGGEKDVFVTFPSDMPLPRSFPRGICVSKGERNLYRAKAQRVLMWLRQAGYTQTTAADLAAQKLSFAVSMREFENLFDEKSH